MTETSYTAPERNAVQPFYFLVPFWGVRYRTLFVDFCLPTLLAPNNIPLLRVAAGHRFIIATTSTDWAAIQSLPIIEKLREHMAVEHLEICPPSLTTPGSNEAVLFLHECMKMLLQKAFEARAYGFLAWPDILVCDGVVLSMLKWAAAGYNLVAHLVLRQTEDDVIAELSDRGIWPEGLLPSMSAEPIVLSPRLTARMMVRHLHSEVSIFEATHPGHPSISPFRYWVLPEKNGLILHTYVAHPLLMNFRAISQHNVQCFATGLFEDRYIADNFLDCGGHYVVRDSDEYGQISLTPAHIGRRASWAASASQGTSFPDFVDRCRIRLSMFQYASGLEGRLNRDFFRLPIRWHEADIDEGWRDEERKIARKITLAIGDYLETDRRARKLPPLTRLKWLLLVFPVMAVTRCGLTSYVARAGAFLELGRSYLSVLLKAAAGNRAEWNRITSRVYRILRGR